MIMAAPDPVHCVAVQGGIHTRVRGQHTLTTTWWMAQARCGWHGFEAMPFPCGCWRSDALCSYMAPHGPGLLALHLARPEADADPETHPYLGGFLSSLTRGPRAISRTTIDRWQQLQVME